jgi:large subunit ribosomal protein L23
MAIFGFKQKKHEKTEKAAEAAKAGPGKKGAATRVKAGSTKIAPGLTTKDIAAPKAAPAVHAGNESHAASVILRPRVTEKSGILSQMGVYTFEVSRDSNKDSIAKAVKVLYKVSPVKIAITNLPAKNVFVKGRHGTVSAVKKALVTLKKGDKIDFV